VGRDGKGKKRVGRGREGRKDGKVEVGTGMGTVRETGRGREGKRLWAKGRHPHCFFD